MYNCVLVDTAPPLGTWSLDLQLCLIIASSYPLFQHCSLCVIPYNSLWIRIHQNYSNNVSNKSSFLICVQSEIWSASVIALFHLVVNFFCKYWLYWNTSETHLFAWPIWVEHVKVQLQKLEEILWSIKFTCKLVPGKLRGAKERILRNFSPVKCKRERDSPPAHTSIFAVWTIHLKCLASVYQDHLHAYENFAEY